MKIKYSTEFPTILAELQCTLAISTYQKGKVILVSSPNGKNIAQFAKSMKRPMGLAVSDNRIAIACKDTVEVFETHKKLALNFKKDPAKYDAMYFPRATYYTGQLDLHDIAWQDNEIIGVNTAFSCLCKISNKASFEPIWQPPFITELVPEDRCHLNGLTTDAAGNHFVTLLCHTDKQSGWRNSYMKNGLVMSTTDNEILVDKLPMPHSPRVIGDKLFYLLAATGEIYYYDLVKKTNHSYGEVNGFARGMSFYKDYLFVTISTIRESRESKKELPVASLAKNAGIVIFKLSTGQKVAEMMYDESLTEIFDVAVVPNIRHGVILDREGKVAPRGINITEDLYFWQKEKDPKEDKDLVKDEK